MFLSLTLMLLFGIHERERIQYERQMEVINTAVEAELFGEDAAEAGGGLVFEVSAGIHGAQAEDVVLLYPTEDGDVFLPAYADTDYIRVYYPQDGYGEAGYLEENGPGQGSAGSGECISVDLGEDGAQTVVFSTRGPKGNVNYTYNFYRGSVHSMFLTTGRGIGWLHESRENRDGGADMLLLDAAGRIQYHAPLEELKSRGNTSWEQFDKKPYQIKLGEEADTGYGRNLFGMGKHKTWLLLALWQDEGYMATATAYRLAQGLGMTETSRLEYVDLYIDGEYRGLYALTEKVRIDEDGVDIRNLEEEYGGQGVEPGDIAVLEQEDDVFLVENGIYDYQFQEFALPGDFDYSSGYLLELDDNWYAQEKCWFITGNGAPLVFKYPESVNREQIQYISALFQDLEDAIYSETGYNKEGGSIWDYADRESWIKYFAVQEIMMNWDAYHSSTYYHIKTPDGGKSPKIYAGPLWDMDHSAMPQDIRNYTYLESLDYNSKYIAPAFYGNKAFMEAFRDEYGEIYRIFLDMMDEDGWYGTKSKEIKSSAHMDYLKWENGNALEATREKLRENLMGHAGWLGETVLSGTASGGK